MSILLKYIATLGPIGYIPFAPGTCGSLVGFIFAALVPLAPPVHLSIIIIGTVLGVIAATSAEQQLKQKDSNRIVIDEFIGFLTSILFLPRTAAIMVSAFLLFRFFDILKPLMIKKLETTFRNGAGVMADDILAGIYANLILRLVLFAAGA
jgi:phosphatidylglycerophosphatase A